MAKKILIGAAGAVIILLILIDLGSGEPETETESTPTPAEEAILPTELSVETPAGEPEVEGAVDRGEGVLVTRVVDGDTIQLDDGQTVRYIGIDTPESVHPRQPVQCFGKEASQKNEELVLGKRVQLEKDVSETDRFGRLLRYVYVGDMFVNLELVRQGYATASSFPPDVKHQDDLRAAEQEARAAGRGLWGSCRDVTPASSVVNTPEVVSSDTSSGVEEGNGDCRIKGNINSKDEKIYHLPGCGSYDRTSIDTARGERYFCSEEEARAAGWRKAGNC